MTDKEILERTKRLKKHANRWKRLYPRRMPDPRDMSSEKFSREHFILSELVGTTFMTSRMFGRWRKMDEEHSRRALGLSQW